MKYLFFLFITAYLTCQVTGCTEEELPYRPPEPSTPDVVVPVIVEADAGSDILVELPGTEATLIASATVSEGYIKEYYWTKISGPNGFGIVNKYALETNLFDLEKGVYELELTVNDFTGQSDKDTITVVVGALSSNPREFLFGQTWGSNVDYCTVYITNIYGYIPRGSFFKVYARTNSTSAWEEAIQYSTILSNYPYFFHLWKDNLGLTATGCDMPDKFDIKILYD